MFFSRRLGQSQRWHLELRSVDPHWPCEGTQGTHEVGGRFVLVLLMAEIRLTTKDDDYPIIYRVLTMPGGCLGFQPSTVLGTLPQPFKPSSTQPFNKNFPFQQNPSTKRLSGTPIFNLSSQKLGKKRPWRFED